MNTVAKLENMRSYEALESGQEIEKGKNWRGTRTVVISPKCRMIIFVGCCGLLDEGGGLA